MGKNPTEIYMYTGFLFFHSWMRWLLLLSLLLTLLSALYARRSKEGAGKRDALLRRVTAGLSHIQFTAGGVLYLLSPLIGIFYGDPGASMSNGNLRFFAMEHPSLMILSVLLITVGAVRVKFTGDSSGKVKRTLLWFGPALLLMLLAVPWEFSPFTSRPLFRI